MPRVTTDQVSSILIENPSSKDVQPFIDTASAVVDQVFTGITINSTLLAQIEKYLAAHFFHLSEPIIGTERIDTAWKEYSKGLLGEGLKFTEFGQQALALDFTGTLAKLSSTRPGSSFTVIGEQDMDYPGT